MKLLIKLVVLLVLGLVALGVAGYFLVPPAAKKATNDGSQYAFGVPASIAGIGASPGFGTTSVGFKGYELSSPAGFDEKLLSIGKFSVGVGTKSLIGDTKDVDAFVLEDVKLTLVQDGVNSNLLPVIRHMRENLGGGGDGSGDAPAGDDSAPADGAGAPGPKLRLGDVQIKGISATLKLRGIPGIDPIDETFTVPAYVTNLSELTGSEGKTVAEIAGYLMDDLKERALTAADGHVPAQGLAVLRNTLDGGLQGGIDGALDAAKGALEDEAQKAIDDAKGKVTEEVDEAKKKLESEVDDAKKKLEGEASDAIDDLIEKGGLGKDSEKAVDDAVKDVEDKAKKKLKGLLGGGD